jgi:hypothetical protein
MLTLGPSLPPICAKAILREFLSSNGRDFPLEIRVKMLADCFTWALIVADVAG